MTTGLTAKIVLLASLIVIGVWARSRDKHSPLSVSMWLWVGIATVLLWSPVPMNDFSLTAAAIVIVGLASMAAPLVVGRRDELNAPPREDAALALPRLLVAGVGLFAAATIGVLAFRDGIAAATSTAYGSLTLQQVRGAQTTIAQGGGFLSLLSAAPPVLSCLGVYGAVRYTKWWLLLSGGALAASLQTPARLTTLTLVAMTLVFFLYMRVEDGPLVHRARSPRAVRLRRVSLIGGAILGGVLFFNYLGGELGKNSLTASLVPNYHGPAWLLSPLIYFTAGIPALSTAIATGVNPLGHGNSIFSLIRVASVIDPKVAPPETLGKFVNIPFPFNVWTGLGQIWLDFGWGGLVILPLLLGWLATVAHRRAMKGYTEWAWVSAVVASLLLSLPQAYRLFFLDTDFQIIVGFVVFAWIRRSRKRDYSAQRRRQPHGQHRQPDGQQHLQRVADPVPVPRIGHLAQRHHQIWSGTSWRGGRGGARQ